MAKAKCEDLKAHLHVDTSHIVMIGNTNIRLNIVKASVLFKTRTKTIGNNHAIDPKTQNAFHSFSFPFQQLKMKDLIEIAIFPHDY